MTHHLEFCESCGVMTNHLHGKCQQSTHFSMRSATGVTPKPDTLNIQQEDVKNSYDEIADFLGSFDIDFGYATGNLNMDTTLESRKNLIDAIRTREARLAHEAEDRGYKNGVADGIDCAELGKVDGLSSAERIVALTAEAAGGLPLEVEEI